MTDSFDRLKIALADRYAIEREIGSGGMTVYLADDLKLQRKVALKVLRPELASALGPDRFLQEIDIAAKLTHPHILGLHDCGEADGFLYFVVPYIEGESLRDKLAKEGELPIAEAVRILRDVVEALKHAHKHSVVHRDIKPDNVMLAEDHALVTDFGVAKAVSDATGAIGLTTEGVALGTPAYMSPEQAAADPHIDHRADIYAIGVIAYELLTGRPPFLGTTPQMILSAHMTDSPEPVTKYRESVSPILAQLVMKCLEKKAADRWQSAEELLPQLEVLATPSGSTTPVGTAPISAVARTKKIALAASAVAGVLFVAACSGSPTEVDPEVLHVPRPEVVLGIYLNAFAAGAPDRLATLLDLADNSALNTFVIDVKEGGEVSYASAVPLVGEVGSGRTYIGDLPGLLRTLRDHGIYPIARIVCFRDAVLAEARPEWAIRRTTGEIWLDPESNRPWVDPYNPDVWAYNIALAREALATGFAEVQWDYVRFPDVSDSIRATMVFPAQAGRSAVDAIQEFIVASRSELAAFDAPITVDVFGRVITLPDDSGIGQDWDQLVRVTDVILPMVYPALYQPGEFGLPDPNAEPYATVRAAMDSAVARLDRTVGATATVRPWLQAFTQGSTVYGPQEVLEQIRAVEDAGLDEWVVWNPESVYPAGAF